jgi:hypothetical protein
MIQLRDLPSMLLLLAHGLAAGAWLGVAMAYATLYRGKPPLEVRNRLREIAAIAGGTLMVTGTLLAFERLSVPQLGTGYVVILALKVLMALAAFGLVRGMGPEWIPKPWAVLILTVGIYMLASLLRDIYQGWLAVSGGY